MLPLIKSQTRRDEMIVITADQVASRTRADLAGAERDRIQRAHGDQLVLPVARNAGDEIQLMTTSGRTAIDLLFELTRSGQWSVGMGIGTVREPLPADIREASGDAFFAARDAVERAKKAAPRFAIEVGRAGASAAEASHADVADTEASDAEALVALALILRERRSEQGWQVYDRIVA